MSAGWVLLLACWAYPSSPLPSCIADRVHQLTSPLNRLINNDPSIRYAALVVGQLCMDGLVVFLLIYNIVKVHDFSAICWVVLFYGFRALLLVRVPLCSRW